MKQRIGEKIREIRNTKSMSQDGILPGQQSLVSQIEKGIIKSPGKTILEKIADNLETSFEQLIEGTDFDPNKLKKSDDAQYAFSLYNISVELRKTGQIITKMKAFPRHNEAGDENKYDPETGLELITRCMFDDCGRNIEKSTQKYCMSCGEELMVLLEWDSGGGGMPIHALKWANKNGFLRFFPRIDEFDFWYNRQSNDNELKKISKLKEELQKYMEEYASLAEDEYGGEPNAGDINNGGELNIRLGNCIWTETQEGYEIDLWPDQHSWGSIYISGTEYFKGTKSSHPHVKKWWSEHQKALLILEEVRRHLLEYRAQIESTPDYAENDKDGPDIAGLLKDIEDEPF